MFYELQFKAQTDNIDKVLIAKEQAVWFKLKCCRCNLETPEPVEIDPSVELTEIEGSPAGAQLVIRCKDCRTQGNISIEEQKNQPAFDAQNAKLQTILRLDCRNVEPIAFCVKNDTFTAVASDSGTVFNPVDLCDGEWYDYDEKESREGREFTMEDEETQLLAPFDVEESISQPLDELDFENDDELLKEIENKEEDEIMEEKEPVKTRESASCSRHSTPIYQMLERIENKIKADEHQKMFGFDDLVDKIQKTINTNSIELQKDDLWVDKYRPQKFTQLITMDSCNLEVLRWVKQWDFAKDLVMGKSKSEVLQKVDEHRKKTSKTRTKNSTLQDHLERPERKILLIHGQPGLGKTTLAHVVAQTAGYSVIEINASDERMGNSVITKISSALEVKTSFTSERKPAMIVIDEIDGAAAAGNENNLIRYLVKLVTAKNLGNKKSVQSTNTEEKDQSESEADEKEKEKEKQFVVSKVKKQSGSEKLGLLHPIICICNDLYVPALRPLRQVAHILQVKPIGPVQLSLRLKSICDREGLKINTRTLVDLAEVMDSDVRSALNALQFLHKKTISGSVTNFNRELTFGAFKDTVKPPMKIYDAIFHNTSSTNNIKKASPHHYLSSTSGRKNSELLEMIWGSGLEMDKLMNGCFEIYPTVKFFDNTTMDRVNAALELFSSFDLMNSGANTSNGRLEGYLAYKLCGLKDLFSSPVYSPIKYPKEDFENFQLNSEFKAIFKDYLMSLSPKIRSESGSRDSLLVERIPAVLNTSLSQFSNIKSSNPQLMRLEDKQRLSKSVEILSNEGLALRQIKIPESASYKFVLDPPIDRLNLDHLTCLPGESVFSKIYDNETAQDSHTYSLCRLVAAEMEALRIRKQKSKLAASNTMESPKSSAETTPVSGTKRKAIDISQVTLPKDLKKRVARDFFGRPIVIADDNESSNSEKDVKESKLTIWYVQNDGVSNAVRRNIKIGSFLN